jgi:ribose 5-phosphate isomerase B
MKKLITEDQVKNIIKSGAHEIIVEDGSVLTPLAIDRIKSAGLKIIKDPSFISNSFTNSQIKIAIGADHTGVKLKKVISEILKQKGYNLFDVGAFTEDAVDYPDIAYTVANRVMIGEVDLGIIIDATGIPSAITANKLPGIRAATCYNEFTARSSREHNNANILVIGARAIGEETAKSIVEVWLNSKFLGDRHQKRLDKLSLIEEKYLKK